MKVRTLLLSLIVTLLAIPCTAQLTTNNAQRYYAEFKNYFTDDICTELAVPYSAMTDEQLMTAMSAMPQELKDIALKVKNNTWAKREKEFRVFEAKPYSNSYKWKDMLNVRQYSDLQNPTGITADNEYLLIFVGSELPDSIWMELSPIAGNMPRPLMTNKLTSGLNVVKIPDTEGDDRIMFIQYNVHTDTTATSKKLADYPNVPIHIEGGYVNGYFDLSRHTDEDWRDMTQNMMKHYSVQVLGKRVMYHMELENILKACPNTIVDAITWWDELVTWQHQLMGADKYYDRWNDLLMAKDGYEDMYMYATETYTYYEHYTLPEILPFEYVKAHPGHFWGPAHEIGHVNQNTINIVSCTEVSNNLFSNAHLHRYGKTTTRGLGVAECANEFLKKTPYPMIGDGFCKSRMYFQLYLYFHAAEKDTTFYPRLFEALRKEPLIHPQGGITYAEEDQLRFAEKCCEIAQMDLSEFFEAWGFFEPMTEQHIGDYANYYVTLTQNVANKSRARMQQYKKKGGHLMFIEDRIKPSPREDGEEGYRIDYSDETPIGKMGEVGQWGDYKDESVKAEGYTYTLENDIINIDSKNGKGALGFKVYNADKNELIAFGNTYSIKIPAYEKYSNLKVVAAQADGTDFVVPNLASIDDKYALKENLALIKKDIIDNAYNGGLTTYYIGRFYKSALEKLENIYQNALAAVENSDTTVHTYKEWTDMLNNEIERLKSTRGARLVIEEGDEYIIYHSTVDGYYIADKEYGLEIVNTLSLKDSKLKKWSMEPAEEDGYYYFKCNSGEYINDVVWNGANCSGTSTETAVAIKVNILDNGNVYFTLENGEYISINGDNKVVCSKEMTAEAIWKIFVNKKNDTAIEDVECENGEDNCDIYDLQGRKVTNPTRGIYIINGKKVVFK